MVMCVADILIRNGIVFTMDDDERIIKDGAVAIEDGRIVDVGETKDVVNKHSAEHVLDADKMAVLPGFVNVHTHIPTSFFRGLYSEHNLMFGIRDVYTDMGEKDVVDTLYKTSLVSCLELIRFGSTTIKDNYDLADSIAWAIRDTGLRGMISELVYDVDLARVPEEMYDLDPERGKKKLRRAIKLLEEWDGKGEGRINVVFSPLSPEKCTIGLLHEIQEVADRYGKIKTIHLASSEAEEREGRKMFNKSPVEHLYDIGFLGPQTLAAHCIYTNDIDTGLLAKSKTGIMHCPLSQLRTPRRIAPVMDWLRNGIPLGIGTDNIMHDMFTAIRLMLFIANHNLRSNPYNMSWSKYMPTPMEVLKIATRGGAELLKMDDEIGSIEVGKKADLITVNMRKPHLTPIINPAETLLWCAKGCDVETVIVDGKILKDKDGVKIVDEQKILSEGKEASDKLLGKFFELHPEKMKPHYIAREGLAFD